MKCSLIQLFQICFCETPLISTFIDIYDTQSNLIVYDSVVYFFYHWDKMHIYQLFWGISAKFNQDISNIYGVSEFTTLIISDVITYTFFSFKSFWGWIRRYTSVVIYMDLGRARPYMIWNLLRRALSKTTNV